MSRIVSKKLITPLELIR